MELIQNKRKEAQGATGIYIMKHYTIEVLTDDNKVIEMHNTDNPYKMVVRMVRMDKYLQRLGNFYHGLCLTIWDDGYYNERTTSRKLYGGEAWRYINRVKEVMDMGYDVESYQIRDFIKKTYKQASDRYQLG